MKRTHEEFKAEVFERSDKIIKRRKKVKRVVMCCVPVLLCSFIGIGVLSMNGGIKANNERYDGASVGNLDFDNNFSKEEDAYGNPEATAPEVEDGEETSAAGVTGTSLKVVAVTVQDGDNGVSSHLRDENTAKRLDALLEKVVQTANLCEKTQSARYSITVHFSDNTSKNYSIAGYALICKDGIYLMDSASYDSIMQIINGIIS